MSWKHSILRALNFPTKMGTDSLGNKYYEKLYKDGKLSRWVVQKGISNPCDYDADRIPSAWKSWLSKTRTDPPGLIE